MKRNIKSILFIFFIISLTSYSFSQGNPLIGKWEVVEGNSKVTFEFFKDDTYILSDPNKIISKGPYTLINNNQIKIKLTNAEGDERTTNLKFSISPGELLKLTYFDEEGNESYYTIYKRIE